MESRLCVFIIWPFVCGLGLLGLRPSHTALSSAPPSARVLSGADAEWLDRELHDLLGHSASRDRLARLEDEMRPTFAALPKSGDGTVNPAAASYALHRHFAATKAWRLKELTLPEKVEADESSPVSLLKSKVPDVISDLLQVHMGSNLVGLEDLAMLAATVEDVVYGETLDSLIKAYEINNLSISEPLSHEQQTWVIQAYSYLMGTLYSEKRSIDNITRQDITSAMTSPFLQDAVLWASDMLETIKFQRRTMRQPFARSDDAFSSFAAMAQWSEQVVSGLGWAQKSDCAKLKRELLDIDSPGTTEGTVDLSAFYTGHLRALGLRSEEAGRYMEYLGALGTSGKNTSHAIVTNYIYASSLCLDTPTMLTLCCFNECNVLMDAIERRVAQPAASPQLVASVVAELPSSSGAPPRNLSASLLRGLDKIAAQHGGLVPLHSKAFAVWMHRAFPADCPHPAVPGADHAPWVGEAFVQSVESTKSFMTVKVERRHAYDGAASQHADTAEFAEDSDLEGEGKEEELLITQKLIDGDHRSTGLRAYFRLVALICIIVASGFGILTHWRTVVSAMALARKSVPDEQNIVFI